MVLVEHQAVEAHLLGVQPFVEIAVVQVRAEFGIVDLVAKCEVLDGLAGCAEVARRGSWYGRSVKCAMNMGALLISFLSLLRQEFN